MAVNVVAVATSATRCASRAPETKNSVPVISAISIAVPRSGSSSTSEVTRPTMPTNGTTPSATSRTVGPFAASHAAR